MLRLLLVALICSTSYADDGINAFNEARAKIVADRTYDEIKYVIVQQDLAKMISENSLEMSLDDAPSPSSNSSLAPIASPPKKKGVKGAKVSKEVLSALGGKEACKKGDGDDCGTFFFIVPCC
jgi:predicted AAA+ superfamily ATPase